MTAAATVLEDGRRHLRVITTSELSSYRRCARLHHIRYRLRRRPRQVAETLRFGTLIDAGLGAWWAAKGDAVERLRAALEAIRGKAIDDFDAVRAEELLLGYSTRWANEPIETLGVQVQWEAPMINPATGAPSKTYRLGGKCDAIAKVGARQVVIEHKTTSEDIGLGSDYWRRVSALDPQVSTYLSGAKAAGFDVEACIYDVIRKPTIRPLKATPVESRKYTKNGLLYANQRETDETAEEFRARLREHIAENPERYFARGELVRLEADEQEHAYDVWQTARAMREAELAQRYPRSPEACMRFNRACEYFEVCSGEASLDDETLFRTAQTEHEELVETKEVA